MLDGQGYDISCDLVMKVSVGGQVRSIRVNVPRTCTLTSYLAL